MKAHSFISGSEDCNALHLCAIGELAHNALHGTLTIDAVLSGNELRTCDVLKAQQRALIPAL